jgi:hypothetical protein
LSSGHEKTKNKKTNHTSQGQPSQLLAQIILPILDIF